MAIVQKKFANKGLGTGIFDDEIPSPPKLGTVEGLILQGVIVNNDGLVTHTIYCRSHLANQQAEYMERLGDLQELEGYKTRSEALFAAKLEQPQPIKLFLKMNKNILPDGFKDHLEKLMTDFSNNLQAIPAYSSMSRY